MVENGSKTKKRKAEAMMNSELPWLGLQADAELDAEDAESADEGTPTGIYPGTAESRSSAAEIRKIMKECNLLELAELCARSGADSEFQLLHFAIFQGWEDAVTLLVDSFDADVEEPWRSELWKGTPLELAAHKGLVSIVEFLLLRISSPSSICDGETVIQAAMEQHPRFPRSRKCRKSADTLGAIVDLLIQHNVIGSTPALHHIIQIGLRMEPRPQAVQIVVKQLLKLGACPFALFNGFNVVQVAANADWVGVLEAILDVRPDAVDAKGSEGTTPLHLAVVKDRCESARCLLGKNADVGARVPQGGATALHYAVKKLRPEMVQLLCDFRADVKATTHRGASPLDVLPHNLSEEEEKRAAAIAGICGSLGAVRVVAAGTVAVAGS